MRDPQLFLPIPMARRRRVAVAALALRRGTARGDRAWVPWAALLALLTALLAAAYPGRAAATVERSFELAPGGRFVLHADAGDVVVEGTEQAGVRLVMEGRDEKVEASFTITEQVTAGSVEVRIERTGPRARKWISFTRPGELEVRVQVPHDTDVRVRTSGGSVDARQLDGDVELRTAGGSVDAERIGGALEAMTAGGSITLAACEGNVRAETSGGSIDIAQAGGDVEAETSGGSIEIEGANAVVAETSGGNVRISGARGRVDAATSGGWARVEFADGATVGGTISTSGGGVDVALDPDADVDLDAQASGGDVRCDLPVTVSGRASSGSLRGQLGAGGTLLKLRSSGGGIEIAAH